MRQYHVQLEPGDVGEYVLLPGDPARSARIAEHLDGARHLATNREFTTYTGTVDGVAVSVCSTGIGAPSTAIAVEELCSVGARTLIRVGTCGGLQPETRFGDLVVVSAAVRQDGTSRQYVPLAYPAVADPAVTTALMAAAAASGVPHHLGVSVSSDAFYCEVAPHAVPNREALTADAAAWVRAGALASEMECSALYVVASVRRVRAGAVCIVANQAGAMETFDPASLDIDRVIATAIDGVRLLIDADRPAER